MMKKLLVTLIALGFSGVAMAGLGTDGAPHNFYDQLCGNSDTDYTSTASCDESWNESANGDTTGEICKACHTPHMKAAAVWGDAPLWNHQIAQGSFTMYQNSFGTIDGTIAGAPGGTSKLCLGCHDGATALDAFGAHLSGSGANFFINGSSVDYRAKVTTGVNLDNSHPVSVTYDPNDDADLKAFSAAFGGAGYNVQTVLEESVDPGTYYVECASCHEPHQDRTENEYLTRISNHGSEMCLACHDK